MIRPGPEGASDPLLGRPLALYDALSAGPGPAEDGVRELADMIRIDERLVPLLLPIAGGLLAAIKK